MGKECCSLLSRHLWGGMEDELPKKGLRGRLTCCCLHACMGGRTVHVQCINYYFDPDKVCDTGLHSFFILL